MPWTRPRDSRLGLGILVGLLLGVVSTVLVWELAIDRYPQVREVPGVVRGIQDDRSAFGFVPDNGGTPLSWPFPPHNPELIEEGAHLTVTFVDLSDSRTIVADVRAVAASP